VRRLTRRQVLAFHAHVLAETGGAGGIRDDGILDAALESPYTGFEDIEFYPTIIAKAARLAFSLVNDHPFIDGNKRVGVLAMAVLLQINGIRLDVTDDDLIWLGLGLARGELDTDDVQTWITQHAASAD